MTQPAVAINIPSSRIETFFGLPLDEAILKALAKAAAQDLDDFFAFAIGEAMQDLDAAPYGGARFPVEASLDDRTFVRFHLDVGAGDVVLTPLDVTQAHDRLEFAGIPGAKFPTISQEQQFAEPLTSQAYPSRSTRAWRFSCYTLYTTARFDPEPDETAVGRDG